MDIRHKLPGITCSILKPLTPSTGQTCPVLTRPFRLLGTVGLCADEKEVHLHPKRSSLLTGFIPETCFDLHGKFTMEADVEMS